MPDRRIVLSLARVSTSIMPGPHPGCSSRSRERSPSGPATGPGRVGGCQPPTVSDQRAGRQRRRLQRPPAAVLQPGDATGLLDQRHHAEAGPVGLFDDPLRGEDRADRRGGVRADGRGPLLEPLRAPVSQSVAMGFGHVRGHRLIPATDTGQPGVAGDPFNAVEYLDRVRGDAHVQAAPDQRRRHGVEIPIQLNVVVRADLRLAQVCQLEPDRRQRGKQRRSSRTKRSVGSPPASGTVWR